MILVTKSPREVGEGFVRLRHAVHLVLLLDGVAFIFRREEELGGEFSRHRLPFLRASCTDEPAERECETAALRDFARHLVIGATDTARANFHKRRDVAECRFKRLQRVRTAFLNRGERIIDNRTCSIFLPVPHHGINKTSERLRTVFEVGTPGALLFKGSTHLIC